MNALEKISHMSEQHTQSDTALLDLDFFTKKPEEQTKLPSAAHSSNQTSPNDDVMVDISSDITNGSQHNLNNNNTGTFDKILDLSLPLENSTKNELKIENKIEETTKQKDKVKNKTSDVKALSDINVTLDSVHPSKLPPLTAFEEEEGVTVVLHFCKDKPRPDVNVIVISTTSKNTSPIEDYKFQSVVPKVSLEMKN